MLRSYLTQCHLRWRWRHRWRQAFPPKSVKSKKVNWIHSNYPGNDVWNQSGLHMAEWKVPVNIQLTKTWHFLNNQWTQTNKSTINQPSINHQTNQSFTVAYSSCITILLWLFSTNLLLLFLCIQTNIHATTNKFNTDLISGMNNSPDSFLICFSWNSATQFLITITNLVNAQ